MTEVSAKPNFPSARASRRRRPGRRAVLSAGLALAMTAASAAAAGTAAARTAGPASPPGHLLSSLALGLNTAPWDHAYAANTSAGGGADVIQPLLKAADIGLLHYGGGAYADYYDW